MADEGLKSAVVSLFCEFEIGELCGEDEFLLHLVQALKTQSSAQAFDTFVSYFPDEHLLKKTWPHFWSSLHCSSGSDGSCCENEHDGGALVVAELTGDAEVDCFLEMFPGLSAVQVRDALEQYPEDAEAAMLRLMSLRERQSKSARAVGSGLTDEERQAIRACVLKHPSTIVTGAGVVYNPRLPPELFQTISKTRYRDGAVVTHRGEKVRAAAKRALDLLTHATVRRGGQGSGVG